MSDKKIIIGIVIGVLLLASIGYFMVNPIHISFNDFKKDVKEDVYDNELDSSEKFNETKYEVKISNVKSENENEGVIDFSVVYKNDDENETYENSLIFNKEDGTLTNENEITEEISKNETLSDITKQIIEKCKNEKLYKFDSLNMSYYSSTKTNIK